METKRNDEQKRHPVTGFLTPEEAENLLFELRYTQ